jgi:hypothetical protein
MSTVDFGAEIDNEVVSIQLQGSDQTTVPSGEEWKVNMSMGKRDGDTSWISTIRINGRNACSLAGEDDFRYITHGSSSFSTILVEGDTVRLDRESISSNDVGVAISGFKIGQ